MKKLIAVSLILVSLLAACGGRELADLTLIQALGVDGPGPVTLTAVGEGEDETVCHTRGDTLTDAQEGLRKVGRTRLEVTHVAQLVLGEDVDVAGTLRQAVIHRDSGYGATVWRCLAGTTAREVLSEAAEPAKRLKSLEENGAAAAPTVLEVLSALAETGRATLPVVARAGEELYLAGYETVEVR